MTYSDAIRALNDAAYAAIRACADTTQHPMVDRQSLRQIAHMTDELVDADAASVNVEAE